MERVQVRLTRKLAEEIDGVDLSQRQVGDVFPLPEPQARLLVAEQWAVALEKHKDDKKDDVESRDSSSQGSTPRPTESF
jgi:hypothetical protein